MRELLDASSQRGMKVLETLIWMDNWVTARELASMLNVSERTILDDLSYLKKRWGKYLNVDISVKNGILMHNRNIAIMGKVFIDIFNDSTALQWLERILFFPDQNIEFYENKLFVSKSTLNRLLPKINGFLLKNGMSIQRNNNKYRIVGNDELYLRQFFAGFLIELHGLDFKMYNTKLDMSVFSEIVGNIMRLAVKSKSQDPIVRDDIAIGYFSVFYFISLIRESNGHKIFSDRQMNGELSETNFLYIETNFPNICEENLRPIHEYIFNVSAGWTSDEEEDLLMREAVAFYKRISDALNICTNDDNLIRSSKIIKTLYLVTKYRPYGTSVLFDRVYYFSILLKKQNSHVYKLIEDNLSILSANIYMDLSPRLADLIFWMCLLYPDLTKLKLKKTALVVSDFGIQHANFLAQSISCRDNSAILETSVARYQDILNPNIYEKYDMIITTIPDLPITHKCIVIVNDYPTVENMCEIYKLISSLA
ncbi:MAG: helix-turn-helix domain-containing protein [Lawsonibacter sp.]|nr:helix-turn-helix domain-containing protein [Lawsonibacter sp.]